MRKIKQLKERRKIVALSTIILCAILMVSIFWTNAHAELMPVESIQVNSEKEPINNMISDVDAYNGSWKFTKSAKWVDYGKVQVSLTLNTIPLYRNDDRDVLLVVDGGYDWTQDMLTYFKRGTKRFVNNMIDYNGAKIAMCRYANNYSNVLSNFTSDKTALETVIDNFTFTNRGTDYENAFSCINEIMRNYDNPSEKKVAIIFLSVFYPDHLDYDIIVNGVNEVKREYPNVTFRGLQYFSRDGYKNGLDMFNIRYYSTPSLYARYLDLASGDNLYFDRIEIQDFIDDTYFEIEEVKKYDYTDEQVYTEDNNLINMKFNDGVILSGKHPGITYTLKLKDEYLDKGGIYPVGKKDKIYTEIYSKPDENVTTTKTPILADNYKIHYELNTPEGCNLDDAKSEKYASVYKKVNINDNQLSCDGYVFKGWTLLDTDADLEIINDDYFIMPEHDVTLRAKWTKTTVNKTYTGHVSPSHADTLYDLMKNDALMDNERSTYVTNLYNGTTRIDYTKSSSNTNGRGIYMYSPTKNNTYPTYFYRGNINNNNVVFGVHCWKAVVTTSTGGVKLVYNGNVNSDGTCPERAANFANMPYNYLSPLRLGSEGYYYGNNDYRIYPTRELESMYNVTNGVTNYYRQDHSGAMGFPTLSNIAGLQTWINGRRVPLNDSSGIWHYYGDSVTYSNGQYEINSPKQYAAYYHYSSLEGKYLCSEIGQYKCNGNGVYYIYKVDNRYNIYAYYLTNGKTIDDYINNKYIFGSSIEDAGDGTYNLVDTITINFTDWETKYENAINKYYCLDGSTKCASPVFVNYANGWVLDYIKESDKILFSNEIEYSDGKYKLKNPVDVFSIKGNNTYKYSCYTTQDTCSTVWYRFAQDYFVSLQNGKLHKDIYDDITKNNIPASVVSPISSFYSMIVGSAQGRSINLSKYIEDTVYCNDRRLAPDSSLLSDRNEGTKYMAQLRNYDNRSLGIDLSCEKRDSFTVSSTIGNGKLNEPVGLLTLDEFILSGGAVNAGSDYNYDEKIYLDNGTNWWTMTPMNYNYGVSNLFAVSPTYHSGYFQPANYYSNSFLIGVRPVISIKHDLKLNGGKGTLEEPYTFKYE